MITETPQNLAIGLLVVTLLGAIMGYVIASIRASKRSKSDLQKMQLEMTRAQVDSETELKSLSSERSEFQTSLSVANERAAAALKKEESLELHTQFLSQRIHSLESQVAAYEEQQIRLQRDFATYKLNKARELELARIKPESWSQAGHLPVLNKRIPQDESLMSRSFPASEARDSEKLERHTEAYAQSGEESQSRTLSRAQFLMQSRTPLHTSSGTPLRARSHTKLSLPLSQELDIPSLAESELPDSVEELEFELADFGNDGGSPRG